MNRAAVQNRPVLALEILERRASRINSDARVLARHAAVVDEHGGISGSADDVLAGRERDVPGRASSSSPAGPSRRMTATIRRARRRCIQRIPDFPTASSIQAAAMCISCGTRTPQSPPAAMRFNSFRMVPPVVSTRPTRATVRRAWSDRDRLSWCQS